MTALREAAQQALEALEKHQEALKVAPEYTLAPHECAAMDAAEEAITALRAALAQEKAEAMTERDHFDFARWHSRLGELADAYYAAGSTQPARWRARAELMQHALDAATGWRVRLSLAVQQRQQAEPVQEPVLAKHIEFQKAQTQRYFELYNRACETAQLRLKEIARLESRLAAQAEPLTNQCGETCERAKLCATCARALDEPVQKPVAWVASEDGCVIYGDVSTHDVVLRVSGDFENDEQRIRHAKQIADKLNNAPPRRTMVPLTEEDLGKLYADWYKTPAAGLAHFARAVEKAIWEKNHG